MQDSVIDWELAIKLAGDNREFAEKMFVMLTKDLPNEIKAIKNEYDEYTKSHNSDVFKQRVHKLHGALCCCGAPRLRAVAAALEESIHNKATSDMPTLLAQLELEANELIKRVDCLAV